MESTSHIFISSSNENLSKGIVSRQATVDLLSALYGIILVVMGVAFPISQVISIKIPSHYYEVNIIDHSVDSYTR